MQHSKFSKKKRSGREVNVLSSYQSVVVRKSVRIEGNVETVGGSDVA